MANKISSATKVVIPCRISFANIFEPKSINGGEAKYSVSCLIPKEDKKTLLAIHKAVEAAKEDGKTRKWGGKIPPNLKLPLRDGDIDRPDDENYQEHFFVNLPDSAPADRTVGSECADGGGIQKKPRKSEREMTTPLFLLRCVQLGISIADLDLLTIGLVNDMFTERQNDDYPYKELASQEDFDRF